MAIVGENGTWLSSKVNQIVRSCSKSSNGTDTCVHPDGALGCKMGDVPDEPRQWCVFEYADLMEQGLSGGTTASFIEAPDTEVRLLVERSPDKKEFLLTTNDGTKLLLARFNNNDKGFSIFITQGGDPPLALGPAFTMVPNSTQDRWTLHATTCDHCESRGKRICGKRELAYMRHSIEEMGKARICCLDMEIPAETQDGSTDVWCRVCKGSNLDDECIELTSRKPIWNERKKTLNLDFFGRCHLASTRNFQLEVAGKPSKPGKPGKLLFGKVDEDKFVLDFSFPLGMVQAFAAAVSTSAWK